MRLKPEQLSQSLQQGLKPLYVISGDDPLLEMEICDEIRKAAKAAGFDEREVYHAEGNFDWGQVIEAANAMSLFSSRRVIEIRINNGKPGDSGSKALQAILAYPNPDNLFIITLPRLDKPAQNSKWFKSLDKVGAVIAYWPIERNQLPGWLAQRMRRYNMQADRDALALLADRTDGNLLAAAQEIEKLNTLGISHIDVSHIENSVGDASRYDVFALSEAALNGDAKRSLHILNVLQAEGMHALMPLGIIANDIRQLLSYLLLIKAGTPDDKAFQQLKIFWPKKQNQFKSAARRLNVSQVQQCLQLCNQIDFACKGLLQFEPWLLFSQLISLLCGLTIFSHRL